MTKPFGTIAEFDSPKTLLHAAEQVRDAGYKNFDAHSPFPIHGMDDAMGLKQSIMGWVVLVGGFFGLTFGLGIQGWVATSAYPLIISGKPLFSYQAFIPVTFELMVLCASFAAVFGMFFINRLPEWYHALLKSNNFKKSSSHGFFISIEAKDKQYESKKVAELLTKMGGKNVEEIEQ